MPLCEVRTIAADPEFQRVRGGRGWHDRTELLLEKETASAFGHLLDRVAHRVNFPARVCREQLSQHFRKQPDRACTDVAHPCCHGADREALMEIEHLVAVSIDIQHMALTG